MFNRHHGDALVVGAGPVGLFSALRLAQRGVKTEIIDKHWRTGIHSYALCLHPRSLELLNEAGLADALIEQGSRVHKVGFLRDGQPLAELDLGSLETPYPYLLVLPQSAFEAVLEQELRKHRIKVRWNHRLEHFEEKNDELVSEVARLDQVASGYPIARMEWTVTKTLEFRHKFIVGADGYHSAVRNALDIDFDQRGELAIFAVYEFEGGDDATDELRVLFDGDMTSVLWPMADNRFRFSFQIRQPDEYEATRERLNEFIEQRAPWFPQCRGDLFWSTIVQFDRRLAHSMGRDRTWLAGDSAHLTIPAGVQSMNAGMVDASCLARAVADVVQDGAGLDVLSEYSAERLAETEQLFRGGDELRASGVSEGWDAKLRGRVLACTPGTGPHLATLLAQVGLEPMTLSSPA
ncbi:MAG: NAD(P)-binding protein [bacterium]|nr:NAD(P)-binding protein [bacterium]